ncbi:renalase [Pseudoliparis swirei]|uniref:renalase n=1 Tax=Pseudoliparis swirei TaxID=2059687 RepID=UPI0024BEF1C9|nr:renalase [Pseudoliparis swirei]
MCPHITLTGRGPSLVVHTCVPFGLQHLEEDREAVQPIILKELNALLPGLPQPISIKCQKWRYSQVLTPAPGCAGHMTVRARPPLVCAGDSFVHSNGRASLQEVTSREGLAAGSDLTGGPRCRK